MEDLCQRFGEIDPLLEQGCKWYHRDETPLISHKDRSALSILSYIHNVVVVVVKVAKKLKNIVMCYNPFFSQIVVLVVIEKETIKLHRYSLYL